MILNICRFIWLIVAVGEYALGMAYKVMRNDVSNATYCMAWAGVSLGFLIFSMVYEEKK